MDNLEKGKIYIVEYLDASYSYDSDILKQDEDKIIPTKVVSFGLVKNFNKDYLNLSLIWDENKNSFEGLVIPRDAILDLKSLNL